MHPAVSLCKLRYLCAGAAWVLFKKPESKSEVINDFSRDVVNLYRVLQHHLDEFVRQFRWQLTSRDEWDRLMRVEPETLTDIQRADRPAIQPL